MAEDKTATIDEELRGRVLRRVYDLSGPDLAVLEAVLAELPSTDLAKACELAASAGVERDGKRIQVLPTGRRETARALLLRAWDAYRLVLGVPARKRRSVTSYLRGT